MQASNSGNAVKIARRDGERSAIAIRSRWLGDGGNGTPPPGALIAIHRDTVPSSRIEFDIASTAPAKTGQSRIEISIDLVDEGSQANLIGASEATTVAVDQTHRAIERRMRIAATSRNRLGCRRGGAAQSNRPIERASSRRGLLRTEPDCSHRTPSWTTVEFELSSV
jgi:hypothetical protein